MLQTTELSTLVQSCSHFFIVHIPHHRSLSDMVIVTSLIGTETLDWK